MQVESDNQAGGFPVEALPGEACASGFIQARRDRLARGFTARYILAGHIVFAAMGLIFSIGLGMAAAATILILLFWIIFALAIIRAGLII